MDDLETRTPPVRLVCPPSPFLVAMLLLILYLLCANHRSKLWLTTSGSDAVIAAYELCAHRCIARMMRIARIAAVRPATVSRIELRLTSESSPAGGSPGSPSHNSVTNLPWRQICPTRRR